MADVLSISDYLDLITSEHAMRPKFMAYCEALLKPIDSVAQVLGYMDGLFDINTATGDQLDMLGQILSVPRSLPVDDPDIPSVLPDDLYRLVLKCRIVSNFWDGTLGNLQELIAAIFTSEVFEVVDMQDMTIQVNFITSEVDDTLAALLFAGYIIPKPAGVAINYVIQENPFFAWDKDDELYKGWDQGQWNYY